MSLLSGDKAVIEQLLGREPRGLEAVARRDNQGVPMVIRVAPLVDNKPFPTLFWLIDKRVNYAIDQIEAVGTIAEFQAKVDADPELQQQIVRDHTAHIQLRQSYTSVDMQRKIQDLGFHKVFEQRGIGGIADFQRIRCLHTYYAAHLVEPNAIGRMLEAYWQQNAIHFPHF